MALGVQSDHFLALSGIWEDEDDNARNQAQVSEIMKQVGQHLVSAYTGEYDFQTCYS